MATVLAAEGSRSGGGGVSRPGRAVVEVEGSEETGERRSGGWGVAGGGSVGSVDGAEDGMGVGSEEWEGRVGLVVGAVGRVRGRMGSHSRSRSCGWSFLGSASFLRSRGLSRRAARDLTGETTGSVFTLSGGGVSRVDLG